MKISLFFFLVLSLAGCASKKHLQYEKEEELSHIKDYENRVVIKEIEEENPSEEKITAPTDPKKESSEENKTSQKKEKSVPNEKKQVQKKRKKEKKSATVKQVKTTKAQPRLPKMEDSEGFEGRRPIVDPFRVGEKVTLDVTYFNIKAGEIDLMVKPFVEFNGNKAYSFEVDLKSYSLFSRIYSVDDQAKTYVDYETLRPYNLSITIKESKQLAETRTLFDWKENKASYWKKKYTEDHGEETKEINWDIKPYSQNVISALYYLRTFQLKPGKKLAFRVADEGKNIVFTGEVLRREKLETKIGTLETLVVKPSIEVDGAFKPVGDILIWLTDDEHRYVVRIESKIKIGTLIAKLKSIDKGRE